MTNKLLDWLLNGIIAEAAAETEAERNDILEDYFGEDDPVKDALAHYGMPRRSGRYPWGSGEHPYQHGSDFLARVEELEAQGMSEKDICAELGMSSTSLRIQKRYAKDERRMYQISQAKALRNAGYSNEAIANELGLSGESQVRNLLQDHSEAKTNQARETAEFLKAQLEEKGMLDVGKGVEIGLGISEAKLDEALFILETEGYHVYGGRVQQATNLDGRMTTLKVLCKPEAQSKDIFDFEKIGSVQDYTSYDDGKTFQTNTFHYPAALDGSRLMIRYADDEDSGLDRDGTIEVRRGVADLDLGDGVNYSQVRILVENADAREQNGLIDRGYLKGMAIYGDNMPDGVDVIFNTNKTRAQGAKVLKKCKTEEESPGNPFGSAIKAKGGQSYYTGEDGEQHLSLINKRANEGDWGEWSDNLPSQFLSKQDESLIKKQLQITEDDAKAEYEDILEVNNPTVRKQLLATFASSCDASAVDLKAAALPRQKFQVILPVNSLKDNEIYAPNFKDGETVVLIRYPHAGTFEIPELVVNNKNAEGIQKLSKNPIDAVGINANVAARLSGADFDGDTVQVIPNNDHKVTTSDPLKGLEGFDPKMEYPYHEGMKLMTNTQTEMGIISNLITDMQLKGATSDELARAARHSMVVIDAEKHKLDYKQSYIDNNISALKAKYQTTVDPDTGELRIGGASTLISRASGQTRIDKRVGSPYIDPETGEEKYKTVKEYYTDKNGKIQQRTTTITKMENTNDAYTLSSGTVKESIYAEHANNMKQMANTARLEILNTPTLTYNAEAAKKYSDQVASLDAKLKDSKSNTPRERLAQTKAAGTVKKALTDAKESGKTISSSDRKKIATQALQSARAEYGAQRVEIDITDDEWEAIQAGAVSDNKLTQILTRADIDKVRQLATPRSTNTLSEAKINRLYILANSGYTNEQIASALGISTSTVHKYLMEK